MPWVDLPTSRQYGRTIALNGNWPRITVNFEDSYVDVDIQEREGGSWQEATLDELPNNAIHFLFERPRPLEGRQVAPRGPFAAEGAVDHWQEEGAVEDLPGRLADLVENALGLGGRG